MIKLYEHDELSLRANFVECAMLVWEVPLDRYASTVLAEWGQRFFQALKGAASGAQEHLERCVGCRWVVVVQMRRDGVSQQGPTTLRSAECVDTHKASLRAPAAAKVRRVAAFFVAHKVDGRNAP